MFTFTAGTLFLWKVEEALSSLRRVVEPYSKALPTKTVAKVAFE
jgi:hypothetical protein